MKLHCSSLACNHGLTVSWAERELSEEDWALAQDMDGWCHMRMVLKFMHTFLIDVEECYLHVTRALCCASGQHTQIHNIVSIICERRSN